MPLGMLTNLQFNNSISRQLLFAFIKLTPRHAKQALTKKPQYGAF